MVGSWEDLGILGEGIWTVGQRSLRDLRVAAVYQPLQMYFNSSVYITSYGHIADELEISCAYTTNFPEIPHYELLAHGCI